MVVCSLQGPYHAHGSTCPSYSSSRWPSCASFCESDEASAAWDTYGLQAGCMGLQAV